MSNEPRFISSIAGIIVERILKSLIKGAIKYPGREAVEEIVREVIRREAPTQPNVYSPTVSFSVAVDEVYAIIGNDNRMVVTERAAIMLASPGVPTIGYEERRQITRAWVKDLQRTVDERRLLASGNSE